jgi:hypothetical protein
VTKAGLGAPVDIVVLGETLPLLRLRALVEGAVRSESKYYYLVTEAFVELEDVRGELSVC